MFTIGTAGHVDHGKSTLVKALTGTDPDRLPEEKQREMTIDLGFAWLKLPNGAGVSIVDVPGHERFIKNMLAGVGGIDLALLVIAADEGPMPQTREHLAILDLLQVSHGLVALTKRDLVEADWLELVREDVRKTLAGTALEQAPILPVSSTTRDGLPELLAAIQVALDATPPRADRALPRLPVDRVFTLTGFGTVVTGTLTGGAFDVGEEVEVLPSRRRTRIRGLQTHNRKVEHAPPGGRTAINLAGINLDQVQRGDVIARPGQIKATKAMDVRLRLIPDALRGVSNNDEVSFFTGASETLARVTLLDGRALAPGEEGWVRLRLQQSVAALKSDRFILRLPSPSATIGGGEIADTAPRLHRRYRAQTLEWLRSLAEGSPEQVLLQAVSGAQPVDRKAALEKSGLPPDQAALAMDRLLEAKQLVLLDAQLLAAPAWDALSLRVRQELDGFHKRNPFRPGMPKEELKGRLGLTLKAFNAAATLWQSEGAIAEREATVALSGFSVRIPPDVQSKLDRAMHLMAAEPYSPPAETELGLTPEEVALLVAQGRMVRVSEAVSFEAGAYERMLAGTTEHLLASSKITVAEFRDFFKTSRKYALAFLEHLDERKITRRTGDDRILLRRPQSPSPASPPA